MQISFYLVKYSLQAPGWGLLGFHWDKAVEEATLPRSCWGDDTAEMMLRRGHRQEAINKRPPTRQCQRDEAKKSPLQIGCWQKAAAERPPMRGRRSWDHWPSRGSTHPSRPRRKNLKFILVGSTNKFISLRFIISKGPYKNFDWKPVIWARNTIFALFHSWLN